MRMPCHQRCERNPHVIYPERSLGQNNGTESGVNIIKTSLKSAATVIEYGLIAAGIVLAIIALAIGPGFELTSINTSLR